LAAQFLAESLLIVLPAGCSGFVLAVGAIRTLVARAPSELPLLSQIGLDGSAVAFVILVCVAATLLFGLLPLTRRLPSAEGLTLGRTGTGVRGKHLSRSGLLVGQIALSLVLVSAAGLLVKSFRNLTSIPAGLSSEGVLTLRVSLPKGRYDSYPAVSSIYRELTTRLEAIPEVERVGTALFLPFTGVDGCSVVMTPEQRAGEKDPPCIRFYGVGPGYFEALGIPVRMRSPSWSDLGQRAAVAVVSESLARQLWPGEDPIGKLVTGSPEMTPYRVIGVAGNVRGQGLDKPPEQSLYLPIVPAAGAEYWPPMTDIALAIHTRVDRPEELLPLIRSTVASIEPQAPITRPRRMQSLVADSMSLLSFSAFLLLLASGTAVFLTLAGIYGVLSYIVAQRRREIGVRIALGARQSQVRRSLLGFSARLTAAGILCGLAGAFFVTRFMESLLFGVSTLEPTTLGAGVALVFGLAILATWIPAARVFKISPTEALRAEQ